MKTPIIHTSQVPLGSIWCIGQAEHTLAWKREMDKKVRRGEYVKVRASWQNISSLKTVYVSTASCSNAGPVRNATSRITKPQEPQP